MKKLSYALLLAGLLGSSGLALAGMKSTPSLSIIHPTSTTTSVSGGLGTIRASADSIQRLTCTANVEETSFYGACMAMDASGTFYACSTTNERLVTQIRSIQSDARVTFNYINATGRCTGIWSEVSSMFQPKAE